ncbi:Multidrug resistance 3-like protein [Cladobotryum mycophilum]|uniref:Multidrug resistance 3-like protein n=1 Tax=Cladobotryum mycophilum TaxID=491253 RepID=A0ABR0SFR6_9HYPO
MATEYRVSLSYPNPSLGQMATGLQTSSSLEGGLSNPKPMPNDANEPVTGARRVVLIISLLTGLLFSTLDTSIVSTSLVTISNELGDFVNASWIVLAYLLTYMGFAVCISKLSDIYGRKNMLVLSWVIFVGFSLGCASSKDMTALIICRAFQGVGASGLYSLTQIGLVEVGPVHRPSLIGAMVGATLAVAFVLGPLIGGIISHFSDWRWLFNMNIPFGLLAILGITNFWPQENVADMLSWEAFTSIDFIGSATLLCSSGLLVFAIQQAGSQTFAWDSPEIISAFVVSGLSWGAFIWWEIVLDSKRHRRIEPIFPIRLVLRRVYLASLIITLLTGFPYISLSIIIPERFQIVNGENVLMAGVHILPLLGSCAIGSFFGGVISSKRNNTSYTLIGASGLQLLGVGLMTMVLGTDTNAVAQYAYQAIFGLGVGLSFSAATIMTNILASEQTERASAQGAVAQARVFGGCIGLSICTVIFNVHVNRFLEEHLTKEQIESLHRSPLSGLQLPVDQRDLVKTVYAGAFTEEIKVMAFICAVMVVVSLFSLEKQPAPLERLTAISKESDSSRRGSDSGTEMNDVTSFHQTV